MSENLEQKVMAIIASKIRVERPALTLDDKLVELGIESIDLIEMIFDLEEQFKVEIPFNANSTHPEFTTVNDVVRAMDQLVRSKA